MVFVDGDLTIDVNNNVGVDEFLMIVVRGNITIAATVTGIEGIFVADGGISAGGVSANQLVIEGIVHSVRGNIDLTRGYVPQSMNNGSPAVLVRYRPDLIFNMPPELVGVVSGWRTGQ